MTQPFFITGLPRSRTAWFSVAAQHSKSICFHEPTVYMKNWRQLKSLWTDKGMSVGVSDSGLGMMLPRILDEVKPKTLIIRRPLTEVVRSIERYFDHYAPNDLLMKRLISLNQALDVEHPLVRSIEYKDLNHDTIEQALVWLTGGANPMLHQLMHLNIQADLSYTMEMATGLNEWWVPDDLKG
jgi:hypothetical protein